LSRPAQYGCHNHSLQGLTTQQDSTSEPTTVDQNVVGPAKTYPSSKSTSTSESKQHPESEEPKSSGETEKHSQNTTSSPPPPLLPFGDQLSQFAEYIRVLERRLTALEGKKEAVAEPSIPEDRLPAVPELRYMLWDEYKKGKGEKTPRNHSAIDLLTEESVRYNTQGPRRILNVAPQTEGKTSLDVELPERIRINSVTIQAILQKETNKMALRMIENYPFVMLRPFKTLIYMENELKASLKRLETKWGTPTNEGEGPAEPKQQTSNDSEGVSSSDKFNQVDSKSEGKPPTTTPVAAEQETSEQVAGSSSVSPNKEWLTDSKEAMNDMRCLIKFMDEYLTPYRQSFRDGSRITIRYEDLWLLIRPGDLLWAEEKNVPQKVWRAGQVTGGSQCYSPTEKEPQVEKVDPGIFRYSLFKVEGDYVEYNGRVRSLVSA
jgi:hypothetical protein